MAVYEITSFRGGLSDYEDKGIPGSFKFGANLDIRKRKDSLTCNQALVDEGIRSSSSPSLSQSPSASPSSSVSLSPSASASKTPSVSASPSPSPSKTASMSASPSLSPSLSPSASSSPSHSVSPSPSPSAGLSTVFAGLIRFFIKGSDGYVYGFDNTGRIYRRDSDAFWQLVYTDPDGAIKGAEEKPSSGGKTYLYWATDTKLKRKELPGVANWNDTETVAQNLISADWHTMKQVGGSLMIANYSYIAMVGYDDSYTNEALDLIPGNIAKTLVERNGRVIVGTVRAGDNTKGINAAIDAEYPLAQVGNDGELYFSNMNDSMPITRFPGGGYVNPGGVCNEIEQLNFFEWEQDAISWIDKQTVGNLSLWAVYNADSGKGGIYSYGRKKRNHPVTLNLEYQFDADELGALVTIEGVTLVSYRDGTSFGVKAVDSTTKAQGIYEGLDFKAPVKTPAAITVWNQQELFFAPLPDGTSIEFWYRVNKNGSFVRARTADGEVNFATANAKKAVFTIQAEGEIFEPKIVLNPSFNVTPEIYRSRTYFQ